MEINQKREKKEKKSTALEQNRILQRRREAGNKKWVPHCSENPLISELIRHRRRQRHVCSGQCWVTFPPVLWHYGLSDEPHLSAPALLWQPFEPWHPQNPSIPLQELSSSLRAAVHIDVLWKHASLTFRPARHRMCVTVNKELWLL